MSLRPEVELAVLCAAPDLKRERIALLLDGKLDWEYLSQFVGDHRLQQVFVTRLRSIRRDAIPAGLQASFDKTLRNCLQLTRDLVRVVDLLGAAGIRTLPFKGPTLAIQAYGNVAPRSFDDLDILVPRQDVWRARDVLQLAGYVPKIQLNPAREGDFLNSYDEFLLRGPGGLPLVELHWDFAPPHFSMQLGFDECWKRKMTIRLANRELPALDRADLILVLCVHGAKHGWSYLGLVTDLAWLISSAPVGWPELLRKASQLGILRMVLLGLALVSAFFETPPPEETVSAIAADQAVGKLCQEMVEAIFGLNGRHPHDERAILASAVLHIRMRERISARVRYGYRLVTRVGIEDWQSVDLPDKLGFLYPVLRFPRLLFKYRSRVP